MADQQEAHSLSSTFPNPPSFWEAFTPERVARLEKIRQSYADSNGLNLESDTTTLHRIPDIPEDLATLQPPPEPSDGRWRVFGDQYMLQDQLPTLEDQGILNLPATQTQNATSSTKPADRAFELKKLTKSLLLNFLELQGIMAKNPSHAENKVNDLRTIFINIHHILNEYRPHQARESAIKIMEDHLDRTRAETASIRTQVDKARTVLEGLSSIGVAAELVDETKDTQTQETPKTDGEREKEAWAAVDALLAS